MAGIKWIIFAFCVALVGAQFGFNPNRPNRYIIRTHIIWTFPLIMLFLKHTFGYDSAVWSQKNDLTKKL